MSTSAVQSRARSLLVAITAAVAVSCLSASPASAGGTYYIYHWDIHEYVTNAPSGPFSLAEANEFSRKFRWDTDTAHSTRISYNWCENLGVYEAVDVGAHSQAWHNFTTAHTDFWIDGDCVRVRGRFLTSYDQYNRNAFVIL